MSNIRLFYPESLSINLEASLDKHQSHYLSKVMRMKEGENFSLFNENGEWLTKFNQIEWNWIKGHSNDPMNDLADKLAKKATPI